MDGRMEGWKDGRMDGWMDEWMGVRTTGIWQACRASIRFVGKCTARHACHVQIQANTTTYSAICTCAAAVTNLGTLYFCTLLHMSCKASG